VILFKLIGIVLVVLGLGFSGISTAYFRNKAGRVDNTLSAQRAFAASRRRAFWIDIAFVVAGIIVFLGR